jgi:hypothetical protein
MQDQEAEDMHVAFDDEGDVPPGAGFAEDETKSLGSAFELGLVNDFEEDLRY